VRPGDLAGGVGRLRSGGPANAAGSAAAGTGGSGARRPTTACSSACQDPPAGRECRRGAGPGGGAAGWPEGGADALRCSARRVRRPPAAEQALLHIKWIVRRLTPVRSVSSAIVYSAMTSLQCDSQRISLLSLAVKIRARREAMRSQRGGGVRRRAGWRGRRSWARRAPSHRGARRSAH
jgi:hypothetical protein